MKEKVQQLNTFQQIRDEFVIIALTALIATAAVWIYVSMNLLWTAAAYLGFLVFISIIYATIDYFGRSKETNQETT